MNAALAFDDDTLARGIPARDTIPGFPSRPARLTRARIEPISDEQFQFAPDHGFATDILAVKGLGGELIEMVAWRTDAPGRWWLYEGSLPVLGEEFISLTTEIHKSKLRLVENPLLWWRAISAGRDDTVCVLDWSADPRPIFTGCTIVCWGENGDALKEKLRRAAFEHAKPNWTLEVHHGA